MKKVINGFERYRDIDLQQAANTVYTSVVNNGRFPAPTPTMPLFREAIDNYTEALQMAQGGDRTLVSIKNDERTKLVNAMHQLSNYVMFAANGDETALNSSGFALSKDPEPKPPLEKPEKFKVATGINRGVLEFSVERVKHALSYQFEYALEPLAPEPLWQLKISSTKKTSVSGLESGKRYRCRVGAIGTGSQLTYSDEVSYLVQ